MAMIKYGTHFVVYVHYVAKLNLPFNLLFIRQLK